MAYEIWETASGNMAGSFATAEKALAVVGAFVQREGLREAETFALIEIGRRGKRKTIASGASLVRMAIAPIDVANESHEYVIVEASEKSEAVHAQQSDAGSSSAGR